MPETPLSLFTTDSALGTKSGVYSSLIKVAYEKPFLKALDQDTWVFKTFPRKTTRDVYVRWKVRTSFNQSVEFYEEDDDIGQGLSPEGGSGPFYEPSTWKNAEVQVKMARIHLRFTDLAREATEAAWVDLYRDEVEHQLEDFRHGINTALIRFLHSANEGTFSGKLPSSIGSIVGDGLASTQCSASGNPTPGFVTYAGLDRSQAGNAFFRSYVDASTTVRPLTIAQLQRAYAELVKPLRGADPGSMIIVTTPGIVDAYGDIADARRRWPAGEAGRSGKIDLGYSDFAFKGIPIIAPPKWQAPVSTGASTLYFLDKRSWAIYTLKAFDTVELARTESDPETTVVVVRAWLNLVCKAPWQQALICDLASTY